ncbi:hypothetical protein TNCT_369351 [Trichonephila clavata]|uniref:Uncharacterized protein n=1 Tax=Trichonephila clavata TaxID=2740835 RepID=A0A8X6LV64_TRICU|nr:hypothetical protein TNCT_369351 [Trichonephila clavata]
MLGKNANFSFEVYENDNAQLRTPYVIYFTGKSSSRFVFILSESTRIWLIKRGRSRSRQSSTSSTTTESRTCLTLAVSRMTITDCRPMAELSLLGSRISTDARK